MAFDDLTDTELQLMSDSLIKFSQWIREDFEKAATSDSSELIREAATHLYNERIEPLSKLHIRLQEERIARGQG